MGKLLITAAAITFGSCVPAAACTPFDKAMSYLLDQYGESVLFVMETGRNNLVVTTNPETESWTILEHVGPNLCVRASGEGYSFLGFSPTGEEL